MPKAMVIVESPAKARTIEKYLGKNYKVCASVGHIKDLPKKTLGVDIKDDFRPTYEIISGKAKIVTDLKKAAGKATEIYLATDPDREGEAICQHLAEELDGSANHKVYRVQFNEITKSAILRAFENPSTIDQNKVSAQKRPASPPHSRSARRLQGEPPVVAKGAQRVVCRPGPDGRSAHDCGTGTGNSSLCIGGILEVYGPSRGKESTFF
jgi:reverse gyrase